MNKLSKATAEKAALKNIYIKQKMVWIKVRIVLTVLKQ
jgi:hypothetical protein